MQNPSPLRADVCRLHSVVHPTCTLRARRLPETNCGTQQLTICTSRHAQPACTAPAAQKKSPTLGGAGEREASPAKNEWTVPGSEVTSKGTLVLKYDLSTCTTCTCTSMWLVHSSTLANYARHNTVVRPAPRVRAGVHALPAAVAGAGAGDSSR